MYLFGTVCSPRRSRAGALLKGVSSGRQGEVRLNVTSRRLVLLDLSVFGYLVFEYSLPSGTG
jgi:hypothetical protein